MPSMSDDLTLIPQTRMVEGGRSNSFELSSDFCTSTQVQAHTNSNVKKIGDAIFSLLKQPLSK